MFCSDDRWRKKSSSSNHQDSENNLFSNDGSFLEKYKTMADKREYFFIIIYVLLEGTYPNILIFHTLVNILSKYLV